jgi:glycosyltransferase involved in cell wall biosynthesis
MKIDLVGPSYPFRGGISHFTTLLFRALLDRGHETRFYSFRRQYPRLLFPGPTDRDENPSALREERAIPLLDALDPLSWLRVGRRVGRDRPDLVILPWWSAWWAGPFRTIARTARRRGGARVLFLCHNIEDHEKRTIGPTLARAALRNGDLFIVLSAAEKDKLARLVGEKPIAAARHPSYAALGGPPLARAEARALLGLPAEAKVLLFFGLVRPYKGLSVLLDALPLLPRTMDVRLVVAGEIWGAAEDYRKKIDRLGIGGRVALLDRYVRNDEIPAFFSAADLLVLPYLSATASGALRLAQAYRLPAVASRVGALADEIVEGRTGALVPPGDPGALAEAITRLLESGELGAMAAEIAAGDGDYSWDRLVETIEELALSPTS